MSYAPNVDLGGGGSYRSSSRGFEGRGQQLQYALPIDEVLKSSIQFSEELKYAPELDGNKEDSLFNGAYKNVEMEYNETSPIAEAMIQRLESTNSKRYATGEEAQKHIEDLKTVIEDMNNLNEKLKTLDGFNYTDLVKSYNEKLEELKASVDLKRLKDLAEQINSAAKSGAVFQGLSEWSPYPKIFNTYQERTGNLPIRDGEADGGKAYGKAIFLGYEYHEGSNGGNEQYPVYELHKFRYVKYKTFLGLDWSSFPWQAKADTVDKMIKLFNDSGINPSQYIYNLK